ncbi:MAG: ATP-binding protein [Acidobacteria bacterium]|nr:ATP-binding protein [Acidobacteriota bacterium]
MSECALCNGTGWKPIDAEGVRRVERCACWRAQASARLMQDARIPPRYAKCDLSNFLRYPNEKLQVTLARAAKFIDDFPAVTKGLCLVGPPGIGKTHIAVGALRQTILKTGARGLFYDVRELLKTIRSTYNPVVRTAEMDVLRPVMEAELLVLDDVGAEKPSEWVEETMNLIVNTRYNERRPTIITTNYDDTPDDSNLDSLKVRVGFRMHSRLHEMCEFLQYEGPDFRMLGPDPSAEELGILWKGGRKSVALPPRSRGQARAQLRDNDPLRSLKQPREARELNWPGGKAGRG